MIAAIPAAESILIFGPGEAKDELKNHLDQANLAGKIIVMETSDRMTDNQVASIVYEYFHK